MVPKLVGLIRDLVSVGEMTAVVVEQHAKLALSLADQPIVRDRSGIVRSE